MFSKNLQKYVVSLHSRKFRQKYDKFIVQGPKIALEVLESNNASLEYIFCTAEFYDLYKNLLSDYSTQMILVDEKQLKSISTLSTPNQVLLVVDYLENNYEFNNAIGWSIYLDNVQEPGNVGTILRIADWFGIDYVFLGEGTADVYNPKVIQSSMGAFLRVASKKVSIREAASLTGRKVYSATISGTDIREITAESGILVIGNESKGIQESILNASDQCITIPKFGGAESLNAAVACGIICSNLLLK